MANDRAAMWWTVEGTGRGKEWPVLCVDSTQLSPEEFDLSRRNALYPSNLDSNSG